MAVGLAPVVEPRHCLLADVAALREAHRALVEAGLLGDRALVDVHPVAGSPVLDAHDLRGRLAHGSAPASRRAARTVVQVGGLAQHVDALGGRDQPHRRAADLRGRVGVLGLGPKRVSVSADPMRDDARAPGPISESSPHSSVRLCSSTS